LRLLMGRGIMLDARLLLRVIRLLRLDLSTIMRVRISSSREQLWSSFRGEVWQIRFLQLHAGLSHRIRYKEQIECRHSLRRCRTSSIMGWIELTTARNQSIQDTVGVKDVWPKETSQTFHIKVVISLSLSPRVDQSYGIMLRRTQSPIF